MTSFSDDLIDRCVDGFVVVNNEDAVDRILPEVLRPVFQQHPWALAEACGANAKRILGDLLVKKPVGDVPAEERNQLAQDVLNAMALGWVLDGFCHQWFVAAWQAISDLDLHIPLIALTPQQRQYIADGQDIPVDDPLVSDEWFNDTLMMNLRLVSNGAIDASQ